MLEVSFVTWDGGGNLPPALGVARALRECGDGVRFLGHTQQRGVIEMAGFRFTPYRHARPWSAAGPELGEGAEAQVAAMFA